MGYRMDVFNVDDPNLDPARLNRVLIARGIRGIVLDPSMGKQMDPPFALDWPQFAFAMIGYNLFTPFLHRAVSNHYLSMQLILQNLRQRGYRRIGLCIPRDINRNRRGMFAAAFLNDQTDQPRREQIPIHFCEISETSVAGTAHWIRQHRPDAIIALSGKELRMALTQCGLSVPQDVGIAHLHTHPSMTDCAGIDPRPTAVAAAAVDLVVGQLNRNEYGIPGIRKTVEIDPAWVDGTSLRIGASLS
jgi:DNA-binding LacI/PurR family transcriptional regulator